jgi:Carboxypeptidase regulatory-like domain
MTVRLNFIAAALVLFLSAFALYAQNPKHETQLKTVRGVVTDKSDNPINAGVVFLKNLRTNQVRSNITNDQGNYRFSGIDPNAEYELYAEKDGPNPQHFEFRESHGHRAQPEIGAEKKLDTRSGGEHWLVLALKHSGKHCYSGLVPWPR